jgi:hypothetical protein
MTNLNLTPFLIAALVGGALLFFIALAILIVVLISKRKPRSRPAPLQAVNLPAAQTQAVQDERGNWWYQNPQNGTWFLWNGVTWQPWRQPAPSPNAPPPTAPRRGGTCLISLLILGSLTLLVFGVFFLITFQFIPGLSIPPIGGANLTGILTTGGIGLLLFLLGGLSLQGGLSAIRTRRTTIEVGNEYYSQRREVTGCRAVISGIGRVIIGLGLLLVGLVMLALTLYLQVLPWLGF